MARNGGGCSGGETRAWGAERSAVWRCDGGKRDAEAERIREAGSAWDRRGTAGCAGILRSMRARGRFVSAARGRSERAAEREGGEKHAPVRWHSDRGARRRLAGGSGEGPAFPATAGFPVQSDLRGEHQSVSRTCRVHASTSGWSDWGAPSTLRASATTSAPSSSRRSSMTSAEPQK